MEKRNTNAATAEHAGARTDRLKVLNLAENQVEMKQLEAEMKTVRPASSSCGLCKIVIGAG